MLGLMAVVLAGLMGGLFGTGRPVFRRGDARPAVIVISFPGPVPALGAGARGTYIYHFFPSVPFVILALVLWQDAWAARSPGRCRGIVLIALSVLLFAAFFPYLSGVRVSVNWLSALQWFPNWLYF